MQFALTTTNKRKHRKEESNIYDSNTYKNIDTTKKYYKKNALEKESAIKKKNVEKTVSGERKCRRRNEKHEEQVRNALVEKEHRTREREVEKKKCKGYDANE